jgi:Concanavalin A-like lectin/glucanases superfamily
VKQLFFGLALFVVGALCLHNARGQMPGTFVPISVGVSGGGLTCTPNNQGVGGAQAFAAGDANVMALLHFDNNGTDNAIVPHNLTLNGGANYSNVQSKFGGYALNIPTAGTSFAQQAAGMLGGGLGVGNGDLTIEGWVYWPTPTPTYFGMIGDDQATTLGIWGGPNLSIQIAGTTAAWTPTTAAITANIWHHLAGTRASGGAAAYYLDGVAQAGTPASIPGVFGNATSGLKIGRSYSATYVMPNNSFIDEVRISNVVRYTANFVPALLPFCTPVPPTASSTYRYWRLDITAGTSGPARIAEWTMNVSGVNQIPAMTGYTTSGVTISGPGNQGAGSEEWRAADRVPSTFWYSGPSPATWIKVDLGSSKHIDNYTIQADINALAATGWTLKGSNDDSFYFNIDTQASQTWTAGQIRSYTPPNYP